MQEDPRILELRAIREKVRAGGGEERIAKQHAKGKLTARERLNLLLDPGTFNELEPYITHQGDELGTESEKILGEGVVTGYGQINGRTVYVYAQDFTVFGGTLSEMQSHKICRVMDLAVRNGTPIIGLIDLAGRASRKASRAWAATQRSSAATRSIPALSRKSASCSARARAARPIPRPDRRDHHGPQAVVHVPDRPAGDQDCHRRRGGHRAPRRRGRPRFHQRNGDARGRQRAGSARACRTVLDYLPSNNVENPPFVLNGDDPLRMDDELNSIVPLDPSQPYSMHEVIRRVVDQGAFLEFQPTFARNAIIGLARIGGHSVGIVSQEPNIMAGVIDIDAADKITRFVRMCDCFNLPLVTFVDSPGFLPGVDQEHRGIIRHGAKVLYAYSEATVPKISVITRKAYGGAYVVMSSKYLGTDVNYAWPSAEIAVMGAEGAVNILYRKEIAAAEDPDAERARLAEEYRRNFNNPYHAASAGYVDDIIEPRETRVKLIASLTALQDKYSPAPPRKHGNIPV